MLDHTWRKSARSNQTGACVEVRLLDGVVEVRDTKQGGSGPVLDFPPAAWGAFVDAVKRGDFTAC